MNELPPGRAGNGASLRVDRLTSPGRARGEGMIVSTRLSRERKDPFGTPASGAVAGSHRAPRRGGVPDDDASTTPLRLAPPSGRRPRLLATIVILAVVAVLASVGAVVIRTTAGDPPVAPAAASAAAPAPTSTAPPVMASPPPAAARLSPRLIDESGVALPAGAISGIREVFEALRAGDVATIRRLYLPNADGDPWADIAPRVALSTVRSALVVGMQKKPTRGEDVDIIYRSGRNEIGFSPRGVLMYLEVGQRPATVATSASTGTNGGFPTGPSDPYGCLAADRAMATGTISYSQNPCEHHFQNEADPTQLEPDTPATRWALCHQAVTASDPDYVIGARKRYCR